MTALGGPDPFRSPRVVLLVLAFGVFGMVRSERYFGKILHGWDAQFYYAAARSLVHDGDLDVTNDLALTPSPEPFDRDGDGFLENVPRRPDGQIVNVFPIGLSLLEVPWMALGRVVRAVAAAAGIGVPGPPGFSKLEVRIVGLGLIVYFAAGMQVLYSLLRTVASARWSLASVLAVWLGSSLYYYSALYPFQAHAQAFVLIVVTAALFHRAVVHDRLTAFLPALGFAAGGLCLLRPQQLTFPALAALYAVRRSAAPPKETLKALVACTLLFALALLVQGLAHRGSLGEFRLDAHYYVKAGFTWTEPHLFTVVLGPTRGILWMWPIVALSVLGYARARQRLPAVALLLAVHALVQVYVVSCWYHYHHGDSFGARMWCECLPAVAMGLAFLDGSARRTRIVVAATGAVCIAWTTLLCLAFVRGALLYDLGFGEVVRRVLLFK